MLMVTIDATTYGKVTTGLATAGVGAGNQNGYAFGLVTSAPTTAAGGWPTTANFLFAIGGSTLSIIQQTTAAVTSLTTMTLPATTAPLVLQIMFDGTNINWIVNGATVWTVAKTPLTALPLFFGANITTLTQFCGENMPMSVNFYATAPAGPTGRTGPTGASGSKGDTGPTGLGAAPFSWNTALGSQVRYENATTIVGSSGTSNTYAFSNEGYTTPFVLTVTIGADTINNLRNGLYAGAQLNAAQPLNFPATGMVFWTNIISSIINNRNIYII